MWKRFKWKSKKRDITSTGQNTKTQNISTSEGSGSLVLEQSQLSGLENLETLEKEIGDIIVNIIRRASERPAIWWQWLFLFLFGTFAGIGLGILIAYLLMPRTIIVPPMNVTVQL